MKTTTMQVKLYIKEDRLYYKIVELDEKFRTAGCITSMTIADIKYELYSYTAPDIDGETLYIHGDDESYDYDEVRRVYSGPAEALEKFNIYKVLLEKAGITVLNHYGSPYIKEQAMTLKKEEVIQPKKMTKRLGRDDFLSKIKEIT